MRYQTVQAAKSAIAHYINDDTAKALVANAQRIVANYAAAMATIESEGVTVMITGSLDGFTHFNIIRGEVVIGSDFMETSIFNSYVTSGVANVVKKPRKVSAKTLVNRYWVKQSKVNGINDEIQKITDSTRSYNHTGNSKYGFGQSEMKGSAERKINSLENRASKIYDEMQRIEVRVTAEDFEKYMPEDMKFCFDATEYNFKA